MLDTIEDVEELGLLEDESKEYAGDVDGEVKEHNPWSEHIAEMEALCDVQDDVCVPCEGILMMYKARLS